MRWKLPTLTLFCVLLVGPANGQALSAHDILKKAMARLDNARTYQARLQVTRKRDDASMMVAMDVKAETDGKGSIARSTIQMNTEASGPAGRRQSRQMMVDNGKVLRIVDTDRKQYLEQPHRPDRVSKLFERSISNLGQIAGEMKVSTRTVNGRTTYALTSKKDGADVLILVDKATLDLKSLNATKGPMSSKFVVLQQRFNAPIPRSTYVWSPPAGYQRVEPGAGR